MDGELVVLWTNHYSYWWSSSSSSAPGGWRTDYYCNGHYWSDGTQGGIFGQTGNVQYTWDKRWGSLTDDYHWINDFAISSGGCYSLGGNWNGGDWRLASPTAGEFTCLSHHRATTDDYGSPVDDFICYHQEDGMNYQNHCTGAIASYGSKGGIFYTHPAPFYEGVYGEKCSRLTTQGYHSHWDNSNVVYYIGSVGMSPIFGFGNDSRCGIFCGYPRTEVRPGDQYNPATQVGSLAIATRCYHTAWGSHSNVNGPDYVTSGLNTSGTQAGIFFSVSQSQSSSSWYIFGSWFDNRRTISLG